MIRQINLAKRLDYTPDDDPGKGTPDATIFHLKVLTSWQQAVVNDLIASFDAQSMKDGNGGAEMRIHQASIVAAQLSLEGWTNFLTEDGAEVPFKTERRTFGGRAGQYISSDILDTVPLAVIFGIYRTLTESAEPSETDVKNSVAA